MLRSVNSADSGSMSPVFELRVQPGIDDRDRHPELHYPLPDGQHVGLVMPSGQPGGFDIPAKSATDTFMTIRRHGFAVSRAAQHNSTFTPS